MVKAKRVDVATAGEICLLKAQMQILQARVRELETTGEARLHVLEIMLARASHGPAEPIPIRTRGFVDERGIVVLIRDSAA